MTMIFSAATEKLIVMTVDSAVTNEFACGSEYETKRKYFPYESVGCVTTWGELVGNNIDRFLSNQKVSPKTHSVEELSALVMKFLLEEYKAHDTESDDIGFHVAGFDRRRHACLYHIFWGAPRPNPEKVGQAYHQNDHSPTSKDPIQLVYNGRNDIFDPIVKLMIKEIKAEKDVKFDPRTPIGLASLGDFIARIAGELTPEVGPPFFTILISPENMIKVIKNELFHPIDREVISKELLSLGFEFSHLVADSTQKSTQQKISHVKTSPFIAPSGISMPTSSFEGTSSMSKLGPYHSEAGTVSPWNGGEV